MVESGAFQRPEIIRALNIVPSHKSANLPTCHFREAEANLRSFLKNPRQTYDINFSFTTLGL